MSRRTVVNVSYTERSNVVELFTAAGGGPPVTRLEQRHRAKGVLISAHPKCLIVVRIIWSRRQIVSQLSELEEVTAHLQLVLIDDNIRKWELN